MSTDTLLQKEQGINITQDLRKRLVRFGGLAVVILVLGGITAYIMYTKRQVEIDTAVISAPLIKLAPTVSGRLNTLYVHEGDRLPANVPVALVGTDVVKTKIAGLIVHTNKAIGAQVNAGTPVVTMINPIALRVVGKIDENKGLSQIAVGDPVTFTVDTFGSKKYHGIIDEISPTSVRTDVVFSISDQRPTNQFYVYVRFDTVAYPELKNGMSARIRVHTP
ncbi:MAG TPA: HlyD family efflux transporter periplasmic adaptor subunit [Candidatus Kaiserbacteria bacterium]|nr:HlyD family efflux transporter periplasmic adaptor subunit [Candidatus Kaiserbacteria bacterium]